MIALPGSKACLSLSGHELTVLSGLHHGLTFKPASRMESDEASCNSRLPVVGARNESLVYLACLQTISPPPESKRLVSNGQPDFCCMI
jgi:hypothetical protein